MASPYFSEPQPEKPSRYENLLNGLKTEQYSSNNAVLPPSQPKKVQKINHDLQLQERDLLKTEQYPSNDTVSQPKKVQKINHDLGIQERDRLWVNYFGDIPEARCVCCRTYRIRRQGNEYHTGHIVAESRGGHRDLYNRAPMCPTCNAGKGGMGTHNMFDWVHDNHQQNLYQLSMDVYKNYELCCLYDEMYEDIWEFVLNRYGLDKFRRGGIRQVDKICEWLKRATLHSLKAQLKARMDEWQEACATYTRDIEEIYQRRDRIRF